MLALAKLREDGAAVLRAVVFQKYPSGDRSLGPVPAVLGMAIVVENDVAHDFKVRKPLPRWRNLLLFPKRMQRLIIRVKLLGHLLVFILPVNQVLFFGGLLCCFHGINSAKYALAFSSLAKAAKTCWL